MKNTFLVLFNTTQVATISFQLSDFLFVAQQFIERYALERQIDVSLNQKGLTVTLPDGTKKIVNPENVLSIFKKIPGTPLYWKQFRQELFAAMNQLGQFHLFFTLSCGESRWPEEFASILRQKGHDVKFLSEPWNGNDDDIIIDGKPFSQYREDNISSVTKFFQEHYFDLTRNFAHKVDTFINKILMSGQIEHYKYRVEFQARGMPHIHGVAWFKKEVIKDYLDENGDFDFNKIQTFVDKNMTVSADTGDPKLNKTVKDVQTHKHTKSCQRGGKCRFGYNKLPSDETLIALPLSDEFTEEEKKEKMSKAKKILEKAKEVLDSLSDDATDITLMEFLTLCELDYDEYKDALKISENGVNIILKRTVAERSINNYNPLFLKAWRANIDVQLCLDPYSVITYITDYITKYENEMTEELLKAVEETKNWENREAMHYCIRTYFQSLEVGVSQSTYKVVPGLKLKHSNLKTIFCGTGFPQNRSSHWQKVLPTEDRNEEEDDDDCGTEQEAIAIEGREGKYKKSKSYHSNYRLRPECLRHMCLAQFATSYEPTKTKFKSDSPDFFENGSLEKGDLKFFHNGEPMPKKIILKDGSCMVLRKKHPSILRIYSSKKTTHEEVYSEMLLFLPWQEETKELKANDPEECFKVYEENFSTIDNNRGKMFPHAQRVNFLENLITSNENTKSKHICDSIDAQSQQQNIEDKAKCPPIDKSLLPNEDGEETKTFLESSFKRIMIDTDEEMRRDVRNFSSEQRTAFDMFIKFCKDVKRSRKNPEPEPDPPRVIVHGGGGVGKSYLIKTLAKWAEFYLLEEGDQPLHPRVLLLAPTGKAASLIGTFFEF